MAGTLRMERHHTGSEPSRLLRREFVAELARRYPERDFSADAVTDELPVLDAPGAAWIVVYDGDAPIGCGGLRRIDEHAGELKWVYLREAARGRKAGRSLLAELEHTAREHGYTQLRLSTGDRQPEALALYHSAGYVPFDDGAPGTHRLAKDLRPHPDDVPVVFTKYDRAPRWRATLRRLGEDTHGTWLGGTPHTPWWRVGHPAHFHPEPHVLLVPHRGDWVAHFHAPPRAVALWVDVALRPEWTSGALTVVDLDLDVVRRRDTGQVQLIDEDEFAENRAVYGYPDDVAASARHAADEVLAAVTAAREPFGAAHLPWLARASVR